MTEGIDVVQSQVEKCEVHLCESVELTGIGRETMAIHTSFNCLFPIEDQGFMIYQ